MRWLPAPARDRLRFADIDGDGRDDYLVVGESGEVQAWRNNGTGDDIAWAAQGEIASGVGAEGSSIEFADVDGDGRDDYLVVGEYGQVRAWVNNRGRAGSAWLSRGQIASGVGYPRRQIVLGEVNGDRRADYLAIDDRGDVHAWYDNQAVDGPAPGDGSPMPVDPTPPTLPDEGQVPPPDLELCIANRC